MSSFFLFFFPGTSALVIFRTIPYFPNQKHSKNFFLIFGYTYPFNIMQLSFFRWAQFFICPLMIEDAIDREVEAVDSGEQQSFYRLK